MRHYSHELFDKFLFVDALRLKIFLQVSFHPLSHLHLVVLLVLLPWPWLPHSHFKAFHLCCLQLLVNEEKKYSRAWIYLLQFSVLPTIKAFLVVICQVLPSEECHPDPGGIASIDPVGFNVVEKLFFECLCFFIIKTEFIFKMLEASL